jgi:hypothetical protein
MVLQDSGGIEVGSSAQKVHPFTDMSSSCGLAKFTLTQDVWSCQESFGIGEGSPTHFDLASIQSFRMDTS